MFQLRCSKSRTLYPKSRLERVEQFSGLKFFPKQSGIEGDNSIVRRYKHMFHFREAEPLPKQKNTQIKREAWLLKAYYLLPRLAPFSRISLEVSTEFLNQQSWIKAMHQWKMPAIPMHSFIYLTNKTGILLSKVLTLGWSWGCSLVFSPSSPSSTYNNAIPFCSQDTVTFNIKYCILISAPSPSPSQACIPPRKQGVIKLVNIASWSLAALHGLPQLRKL